MKPYGKKRVESFDYPDAADVRRTALPSKFGRLPTRSKRRTRRMQARRERELAKQTIRKEAAAPEGAPDEK